MTFFVIALNVILSGLCLGIALGLWRVKRRLPTWIAQVATTEQQVQALLVQGPPSLATQVERLDHLRQHINQWRGSLIRTQQALRLSLWLMQRLR